MRRSCEPGAWPHSHYTVEKTFLILLQIESESVSEQEVLRRKAYFCLLNPKQTAIQNISSHFNHFPDLTSLP